MQTITTDQAFEGLARLDDGTATTYDNGLSRIEMAKVDQALARMRRNHAEETDDERCNREHYLAEAMKRFLKRLHNAPDPEVGMSLDEALEGFPSYPGVHRRILGAVPRALRRLKLIEDSGRTSVTNRVGCHGGIRRCWRIPLDNFVAK